MATKFRCVSSIVEQDKGVGFVEAGKSMKKHWQYLKNPSEGRQRLLLSLLGNHSIRQVHSLVFSTLNPRRSDIDLFAVPLPLLERIPVLHDPLRLPAFQYLELPFF